jgi:anti-sigma B factor antagonist
MSLSLLNQPAGDIFVVACAGRIVEGAESAALRQHLDELPPYVTGIVLDLADVEFVDSSGLGLLVRLALRQRLSQRDMKLCAIPSRIDQVLTLTRLKSVFESYPSRPEAVAAFSIANQRVGAHERIGVDVLCVHRSADVLAFVRTLLRQAGYGVMSASNLVDALALLQGTPARAVLIEGDLRGAGTTTSAARFHALIERLPIVEVPADFATRDPGVAGEELLARVGAVFGRGGEAAALG